MAAKKIYYDTSVTGNSYPYGGVYWGFQTFTTVGAFTIASVRLPFKTSKAPGTVTVSIKAVDGNSEPTGADLAVGTIDGDSFQSSFNWETITFSTAYALSASTEYAIVVRALDGDGGGGGTASFYWGTDVNGGYANGMTGHSTDSGVNWDSSYNTWDAGFETYSGTQQIPVDKIYSKKLIAVGNREFWYEDSAGSMAELAAANNDIDANAPLQIFEAFQKVFVVNKSNLKVADFGNVKITTANVGSHPPDKGNILTGASGAKMVVDYATTLTSACTIYGQRITTTTFPDSDTITGTDDDDNSISFTLNAAEVAGPHWYDWTVYGGSTTYGVMPTKATLGCLYRGRAVLSGNSQYPNQWYMARIGHPWDFNYDGLDALSAVAGNNADAGEIGDIVVALIPYKDDFIVFGCANTMWVMVGDPASGGSIDELDLTVGIFGSKAWCFDSSGNLYFWGTGGIYVCPYTGARPSKPQLLTGLNLPKLIKDEAVDVTTHRITLTYDPYREGILIFITKLSDGSNSNYWYDLKTEGFFPESYPKVCGVYSAFYYNSTDNTKKDLILGGFDGYMRKYLDTAKDDDSGDSNTAISSYLTLIQQLGDGEDIKGKLTSLTITTAGGASGSIFGNTDKVSYEYHTGDDAETVLENIMDVATARESGTIDNTAATGVAPGRQKRIRKRLRGHFLGLKLFNSTDTQTWAIEKITGEIKPAGKN